MLFIFDVICCKICGHMMFVDTTNSVVTIISHDRSKHKFFCHLTRVNISTGIPVAVTESKVYSNAPTTCLLHIYHIFATGCFFFCFHNLFNKCLKSVID